jgi:hypothetical protein
MDRRVRIIAQLKQVFEPYCIMFRQLKGEKKQLQSQCFCKEKKDSKKY